MGNKVFFFIFVFWTLPVQALNTSDYYAPGFSDLEMLSSSDLTEYFLSMTAGYGHSRYLNPSISVMERVQKDSGLQSTDWALANISSWSWDQANINIIPSVAARGSRVTPSLSSEWIFPLVAMKPYIRADLCAEKDEFEKNASLGLQWEPVKKMKVLLQLTEEFNEAGVQEVAVGLNYKLNSLEVMGDFRQGIGENETVTSVGVVWSR